MADKIQIKLYVGKQLIPLTIDRAKEGLYREAAHAIQDKLNLYRTRYPEQSEERYLSIVLLDFAVRALAAEQSNDTEPYTHLMQQLSEELEQLLKE